MLRHAPWQARDSGAKPREQAVNKQKIGAQADRIAEQPLAVAPKPVDLRETAAPSVPLPALQPYPHHPASALANGRSHAVRKKLASGDDVSAGSRQGNEDLRTTELMQPQAVLVVFGEASRLKDQVTLGGCEFLERLPRETGSDSVGRNEAAHNLAGRHVFDLPLGELVAVDPVHEFTEGHRQGQHWDLNHLETIGVGINLFESAGMNQVFSVMRDDDIELNAIVLLKKQHALVYPVEAIRFGRWAVVRAYRQMNVGKTRLQVANGVERRLVIRISPDEKVVVVVVDGGHVVLHHAADDRVFVPQGHHDGDRFFVLRAATFLGPSRAKAFPPEPGPQADGIEDQIIQSTGQD